jgi:hypothetical protein
MSSFDNAFQSPGFPSDLAQQPDASTPKTIGVLNIIFSSLLLLCGTCGTVYTMMLVVAGPLMQANEGNMKDTMQQIRDKELEERDRQIEKTDDADVKQQLQAERDKRAAEPVVVPDFTKVYGMSDPRVTGYYLVDLFSALLLNLGMLVSGIGLIGIKEWGRRLGIWVARLKLLRLVVLYGIFLAVVMPIQVESMREGFAEMEKMAPARGNRPPNMPAAVATGMTYTLAGTAIGMVVLGAIYPAISWLLLRRESVKAACTQEPGNPYVY